MKICRCSKHTHFEPRYRLEVMAAVAGVVSERIIELRNDDNSREVELLRAFYSDYCNPTDDVENSDLIEVVRNFVNDAMLPF